MNLEWIPALLAYALLGQIAIVAVVALVMLVRRLFRPGENLWAFVGEGRYLYCAGYFPGRTYGPEPFFERNVEGKATRDDSESVAAVYARIAPSDLIEARIRLRGFEDTLYLPTPRYDFLSCVCWDQSPNVKFSARYCAVALLKGSQLPKFEMEPENGLTRALGFDDIDFNEHREFSRAYRVFGPNEGEIRAFLTREMMDVLLVNPGWYLDCDGTQVVLMRRPGSRIRYTRSARAVFDALIPA